MSEWIPSRIDLHRDHTVISIAADLGVNPCEASGMLLAVWGWFSMNSADGFISAPCRCDFGCNADVTLAALQDHANVCALAKLLRYFALDIRSEFLLFSMHKHGWAKVNRDGIAILKWDRWMSQGAKRRELTNRRVKRHRESDNPKTVKRKCNARSVSKALPQDITGQDISINTPLTPHGGNNGSFAALKKTDAYQHAVAAILWGLRLKSIDAIPPAARKQIEQAAEQIAPLNLSALDYRAAWSSYSEYVKPPHKTSPRGFVRDWPKFAANIEDNRRFADP